MMEAKIVNRFWVRILMFCGLLGAAGLLWGLVEARIFDASSLFAPSEAVRPSVAWVFPVFTVLLITVLWLAVWMVRRDVWKSLEALAAVLLFLGVGLTCVSMVYIISDPSTALPYYCGMVVLILYLALTVGLAIRRRRIGRRDRERPAYPWIAVASVAVLVAASIALGRHVLPGDGRTDFDRIFSFGGFSLPLALTFGGMDSLDLAGSLLLALLFGGLSGAWFGFFASATANRRIVSIIGISAFIGAIISATIFAVHTVLLLKVYEAAWDYKAFLPSALWLWALGGILLGLMLACIVQVLSTEQSGRGQALKRSLALIVPVLLVAYITSWAYVHRANGGLALLQEASRLEGRAFSVGFSTSDTSKRVHANRVWVIVIKDHGTVSQSPLHGNYSHTIALCDDLLRRYPHSAYRSTALFLKFQWLNWDWRPLESLDALSALQRQYPRYQYDPSRAFTSLRVLDLALVGRYKDAVLVMRSADSMFTKRMVSRIGVHSAEILGLWDDAMRGRTQLLDEYARTEHPRKDWLDKYRANLRHAQHMKAIHAGPLPLTNVSGRVLLRGKTVSGMAVCLVPAAKLPEDSKKVTSGSIASMDGRLAEARSDGGYEIAGLPSGRYEVVLAVRSDAPQCDYSVRTPSLPYDIRGRAVRVPDIVLTPKPAK
jgi:hypothetical protein